MPFPLGWPPRLPSGLRTFRFFESGTSTANYGDNAFLFAEAPTGAMTSIGGLDINGLVLVYTDAQGSASHGYSIEVVRPMTGHPNALAAAFDTADPKKVIVRLATLASGALNTAANTATLVAAAVNALAGISAVANGTGATALTRPEIQKDFLSATGFLPTPRVEHRGGLEQTRTNSPHGTGTDNVRTDLDPYRSPSPMVYASTIQIYNDDSTATNTLFYSFDGVHDHGQVRGGEKVELRTCREAGIAIRLGAGTPAFRIIAW